MKGYTKPLLIIFLVLLADQVLKTWIKTNMYIGQSLKLLATGSLFTLRKIMEWLSD